MADCFDYGRLIVCAAVKYADGQMLVGVRHADCHKTRWDNDEVQGFLDNKGVFVDRHDAFDIAKAAGQIRYYPDNVLKWHEEKGTRPSLFSENLY